MALPSYASLGALGPRASVPRTSHSSQSSGQPGTAIPPPHPPPHPAEHPHLNAQPCPTPSLQSLTWKEREEGVLDTGPCAPQSHRCGSLGRNLGGVQASARLSRVSPSEILLLSSHLSLGSSNPEEPAAWTVSVWRCNWGKGRHRAWGDLGSAGLLRAWVQATEGEDEGWAEGVSRLAPGWAGS